jgi:hypothetical protein
MLPSPLSVSDGDAVGLPVVLSVGVGLSVSDGDAVGLPVVLSVGVGLSVSDGDAEGLPVALSVGVGLPVAVGVGEAHVGVGVGAAGRADETAAAICSLDPVGVTPTAAGWHCDAAFQPGAAVLPGPTGLAAAVLRAPLVSVPPPPPFRVPLPSVPAPPDVWPPVSTLEVTWPIAWRSGGTASVTIAMNATPASTATGRSQLAPIARVARVAHLAPGQATARGRGTDSGQAQCPCQTQCRARLTAPPTTLSSHG